MVFKVTSFIDDENGAVSVDWVLLTSAAAMLAVAVTVLLNNSTISLAGNLGTYMDNADPN